MDQIWSRVLQQASEKISKPSFETWLKPTELIEILEEHKQAVIGTQNEFARDWIEARYKTFLEDMLFEVTGTDYTITAKVGGNLGISHTGDTFSLPINKDFKLSNFKMKPAENRFAHAGAMSVAVAPGKAYNPLIIYGPPGFGKTHLLHAIANEIATTQPRTTILYVTAQHFLYMLHESQANQLEEFYRNADVLLFDDLEFLDGQVQAQKMLLNIFNHLFTENKQTVFTSNKETSELIGISDQLKTRLGWGLATGISKEENVDTIENIQSSTQISEPEDQESVTTTSTRDLLEQLLVEQKRTNELLEKLLAGGTKVVS